MPCMYSTAHTLVVGPFRGIVYWWIINFASNKSVFHKLFTFAFRPVTLFGCSDGKQQLIENVGAAQMKSKIAKSRPCVLHVLRGQSAWVYCTPRVVCLSTLPAQKAVQRLLYFLIWRTDLFKRDSFFSVAEMIFKNETQMKAAQETGALVQCLQVSEVTWRAI